MGVQVGNGTAVGRAGGVAVGIGVATKVAVGATVGGGMAGTSGGASFCWPQPASKASASRALPMRGNRGKTLMGKLSLTRFSNQV